jgi:uncharacterized protein
VSWEPGSVIRFRYVRDGRAFWTLPVTVARDDDTEIALWVAPGSPMQRPDPPRLPVRDLAAGRWEAVDSTWYGQGILMLRRPETRHAIWLFWHLDWRFRGWYVNLEDWWRDDEGVDAYDHQLDIWVEPDGTWRWKDEDDLAESVQAGIFTAAEAAEIRAEGERLLAAWPFPTGWEDWRPDPAWPLPELPEGWDAV